jgi:hypothetical protein
MKVPELYCNDWCVVPAIVFLATSSAHRTVGVREQILTIEGGPSFFSNLRLELRVDEKDGIISGWTKKGGQRTNKCGGGGRVNG